MHLYLYGTAFSHFPYADDKGAEACWSLIYIKASI